MASVKPADEAYWPDDNRKIRLFELGWALAPGNLPMVGVLYPQWAKDKLDQQRRTGKPKLDSIRSEFNVWSPASSAELSLMGVRLVGLGPEDVSDPKGGSH